ncbi:hypothetical protein DASB73_032810 [Starmerella bacillaris]|uniref:Uncharacterized protein n=1 Tax=Starmerella bacillaris TaxID=1247836 RepID=A0AAV5RNI7_STABA|nr:hypothetical protein DASB73_032810 [Starmerella bacillaris]
MSTKVMETLSNISGSVSLACWTVVLLPQLIEQYQLKSSEGVSVYFLGIWLLGDMANLVGSIWAGLRPNVILLAMWFVFSDSLLLTSYFYYRNRSGVKISPNNDNLENGPAQGSDNSDLHINNEEGDHVPLVHEQEDHMFVQPAYISKLGYAIIVTVVATISYLVSDSSMGEDVNASFGAEFLGFISTALYLSARIPQIIQNYQRKSVAGLSMGFFMLSITGNLTYAGQVILYRTDKKWLMSYLPWLMGSLGTIFEDMIILTQFYRYKE